LSSSIRETIEALIRRLQEDVTPNTVLVPLNEFYDIKQVPSLIVIGPKMEENLAKRVSEKRVERDMANFTYTRRNWPRYYHLDFDFVLTADTGAELLDLQEKVIAFFLDNLEIAVSTECSYYLRELVPLGEKNLPGHVVSPLFTFSAPWAKNFSYKAAFFALRANRKRLILYLSSSCPGAGFR